MRLASEIENFMESKRKMGGSLVVVVNINTQKKECDTFDLGPNTEQIYYSIFNIINFPEKKETITNWRPVNAQNDTKAAMK